jgi:hypothetical protein
MQLPLCCGAPAAWCKAAMPRSPFQITSTCTVLLAGQVQSPSSPIPCTCLGLELVSGSLWRDIQRPSNRDVAGVISSTRYDLVRVDTV